MLVIKSIKMTCQQSAVFTAGVVIFIVCLLVLNNNWWEDQVVNQRALWILNSKKGNKSAKPVPSPSAPKESPNNDNKATSATKPVKAKENSKSTTPLKDESTPDIMGNNSLKSSGGKDSVINKRPNEKDKASTTYTSATFKPVCDLHIGNYGALTPSEILPRPAEQGWLAPSLEEVTKWYTLEKKKCKDHLSAHLSHDRSNEEHAAYYSSKITASGQTQCRGRNSLFNLTGIIVVPFGPYNHCPTYSHCWFGLLSCGQFKSENMLQNTKDAISNDIKEIIGDGAVIPDAVSSWSLRGLHINIRVAGLEIVTPDIRYISIKPSDSSVAPEEVLIGQYHLTLPDNKYHLEMRLLEFYPSVLLKWSPKMFKEAHVENAGSVYLGGSEVRCKAWSKCSITNYCCGCDELSFVAKSPYTVVAESSSDCKSHETQMNMALPLCNGKLSPPGRWIQASSPTLTPHCKENQSYSIHHMEHDHHNKSHAGAGGVHLLRHGNMQQWRWASGNPCMHAGQDQREELGMRHWFFAPYTCKYHFYHREDLHQCLKDLHINHMHFQGDSISRDFFALVSRYLGVSDTKESELRHMSKGLKEENIIFHNGSILLTEGQSFKQQSSL